MSSQIKHNGAQYKMTARFTIFAGLLSFMVDKVNVFHQGGAMVRSDAYKKQMALKSLRHCSDDEQFGELFPELKQEIDGKLAANPSKYEAADDCLVAEDKKLWPYSSLAAGAVLVVAVIIAAVLITSK